MNIQQPTSRLECWIGRDDKLRSYSICIQVAEGIVRVSIEDVCVGHNGNLLFLTDLNADYNTEYSNQPHDRSIGSDETTSYRTTCQILQLKMWMSSNGDFLLFSNDVLMNGHYDNQPQIKMTVVVNPTRLQATICFTLYTANGTTCQSFN